MEYLVTVSVKAHDPKRPHLKYKTSRLQGLFLSQKKRDSKEAIRTEFEKTVFANMQKSKSDLELTIASFEVKANRLDFVINTAKNSGNNE